MSNTKFPSKEHKRAAKEDLQRAQGERGIYVFAFSHHRACVALRRTGAHMGEFAVSICSRDEKKFRKTVGRNHALIRFECVGTQPTSLPETPKQYPAWPFPTSSVETEYDVLQESAEQIAEVLGFANEGDYFLD